MIRTELKDFILRFGEDAPISVRVPATLYSAYESTGRLADATVGLSMKAYESLSKIGCEFVSVFSVDEELLAHRHIALRFHGVLPSARVYVNGTLVGECKNMHAVYTFDIKSALVRGENTLTVKPSVSGQSSVIGRYAPFLTASLAIPPIYDQGIYRPVELLAYDGAIIDTVTVRQEHTDTGVTLHIQARLLGDTEEAKAVATLVSSGGKMYYSGLHAGGGSMLIRDPEYWWPRGLGAQALYRLGVTLYLGGEPEDAVSLEVGLRTVEISERDADGEREFVLLVNGHRFFATGADYMPEDIMLSRIDSARTERLVRAAADANINLLRIPEGTVYPADDFYRLCDRYGILVYQELMTLGGSPEPSEEDEAAYLSEVAGALCRIATHPSVAVIATHYNEENNIRKIPALVEHLAPDAVYKNLLPEREMPLGAFDTASAFPTLTPPVSLPDAKTLSVIGGGEIPNPYSRILEYHSKDVAHIASMFSEASERYFYATTPLQMIYLTQLNAADLLSEDIAYLRRRRADCMGVFALRLNDSWTSVSSCAIDCYARPKLTLIEAGRCMAPLALGIYREGYRVSFMLFNETRTAFDGYLTYTLADAGNNVISEVTLPVHAEGGSGEEVGSVDFSTQVFGHETEYYLTARIHDAAGVHSERTLLFTRPKYFAYQDPALRARIEGYGNDFEIILSAAAFAHKVYISFSATDAVFEDNAIDITKNLPVRVRIRTQGRPTTAEELMRQLTLLSVYDLGR